jgi:hypothetical protein
MAAPVVDAEGTPSRGDTVRRPILGFRTRVIIAVATPAVAVLVSVVLAVLGHPWWISLAIGYGISLWLLEPDDGNYCVG